MAEVFLAVGGSRSLALWVCGIIICLLGCWSFGDETPRNLGDFQSHGDVGLVAVPGSAEFQPERAQYRIAGSGANVWGKEDAFQFLWKKTSGDLAFSMDVEWIGKGKVPHRKACAMVRQDLEADSPYVNVAVHGDGLIALQYRTEKGALTMDVQTPIRAPATVKLERDGDVFTVSVAKNGGPFQPVGALSLALSDPVYAGLAVCSHSADVSETAVFSHVTMNSRIAKPGKKRVRETSLETLSIETGERKLVFREAQQLRGPQLVARRQAVLHQSAGGHVHDPRRRRRARALDTGGIEDCNNDHGLTTTGFRIPRRTASGLCSCRTTRASKGTRPAEMWCCG